MPESKHAHHPKHHVETWQRDICFGCGPANPRGLHLHFDLTPEGKSYLSHFTVGPHYSGPPAHAHGGIIATILDEAMGKALKLRGKVALTRELDVEYLRPVPLGQPLIAEGFHVRMRGRALYNRAEIRNQHGTILARSKGKFIAIDPEKMFGEVLRKEKEMADLAL